MAERVVAALMGMEDVRREVGYPPAHQKDEAAARMRMDHNIALILAAHGFPLPAEAGLDVAHDLVLNYREKSRMLACTTAPVVSRVQGFIEHHLGECKEDIRVPCHTITLPAHGIARALSFPVGQDAVESELLTSYRVRQGVLHNPRSDKRTTQGSFHIAEGGLPITADKYCVPKHVFARMLKEAFSPPRDANVIPYTKGSEHEVSMQVSLLLRPIVCPAIPGRSEARSMEVLCLAPGPLVSCLDFLESIFGNAGDPFLPENDSALDTEHWTGHTGLLVLAPHLTQLRKCDLGLPRWEDATPLQREQGMCWKSPDEKYNDGRAFKCCCRTEEGVILTIVADNYFGYCKKEVKTQLSYAANLLGMAEEEHAGGTLAFPRYSFGMALDAGHESRRWGHLRGYDFEAAMALIGEENIVRQPEGHAVDKAFPHIIYVPESSSFSLVTNLVAWGQGEGARSIPLRPGNVYVLPSGFKMTAEKHSAAPTWRLIGTEGRGVFIHKPCTVSGGGKSELSKAIDGAMMYGPLFISDPVRDFAHIDHIIEHDFSNRFKDTTRAKDLRPLLSEKRSLGSVIKLLTPATEYTDEYNAWLEAFPKHVFPIVFYIKRFYHPSWEGKWREHFSMDLINGAKGHELKFDKRKICAGFLRVGSSVDGWRTFKTRIDFMPSSKVQMEDDISTSVTVPTRWLPRIQDDNCDDVGHVAAEHMSRKLVVNCEFRLFQRPDDCIHRGEDPQAEWDLAQQGNFIANFEPLRAAHALELVSDVCNLERFTKPMREFITGVAAQLDSDLVPAAPCTPCLSSRASAAAAAAAPKPSTTWFVCSANTRLVEGKPTANPRYLQTRPDAVDPQATYLASMGTRLAKKIAKEMPVVHAVDVCLLGRRISKPGPGLPNLCVYNPIHYQELPELFMDLVCCVSGKSPSTTGAGSEGALTKGPFNAMPFSADLNNLFTCYALTGLGGWSTPTGFVGPNRQFGHDISFLSPEVWCRMKPHERDPQFLMDQGYLEKVADFEHEGKKVQASRLGWRITDKFAHFLGRVFDYPSVFDGETLRPEAQDMAGFVDGVNSVVEVQHAIAKQYFTDGTVELLCPPLKALLHIMVHGSYEGKDVQHPDIRKLFTEEAVLASEWYRERLATQQRRDAALWVRHVQTLKAYMAQPVNAEPAARLHLAERLAAAEARLAEVSAPAYLDSLVGTIGADPIIPRK